jgi:hypothetical protein
LAMRRMYQFFVPLSSFARNHLCNF